jgi:hypothetical protein
VIRCYALSSLSCSILPSLPCQSTVKPGTFCLVLYALLLPAWGVFNAIPCPFVMLYSVCHAPSVCTTLPSLPCTGQSTPNSPTCHASLSLSCTALLPRVLASPPCTAQPAQHYLPHLPCTVQFAMHCPVCHALSVYPSLPSLPNKKKHSVIHC